MISAAMSDVPPRPSQPAAPATGDAGRFSLERLTSAFARLMGTTSLAAAAGAERPQIAVEPDDAQTRADDALPVTPRMIVEGMLFIGAEDGRPLASREMAAGIRDVTPAEVDALVAELNEAYREDGAAYEIIAAGGGYAMRLRDDLARIRERFRGRERAAKLTSAALEVLSVVAYRQGVTGEEVSSLRGSQSRAILAQLVRRQLVRVERPTAPPRTARYHTTDRFNQLFRINSPAELPQNEDLEDS
jgi:segregation and condensation protein B